jgi:hypothetical protein
MRGCSGGIRPECKASTGFDVGLLRPQPVGAFVVIYTISASRSYLSVIATRDAIGRHQRGRKHEASRRRILGGSINFSVTFVAVPYAR